MNEQKFNNNKQHMPFSLNAATEKQQQISIVQTFKDCLKEAENYGKIFRHQRFYYLRFFFRGGLLLILRAFPANAVAFFAYENTFKLAQ